MTLLLMMYKLIVLIKPYASYTCTFVALVVLCFLIKQPHSCDISIEIKVVDTEIYCVIEEHL